MKDTIKRSVVKTILFKIITTSITSFFTGIGTALVLHLILTAVYLLYERAWNNTDWGKETLKDIENEKNVYDIADSDNYVSMSKLRSVRARD